MDPVSRYLFLTCLVSHRSPTVESYCVPNFDSPSVFARILDKNKGGHFSINPTIPFKTKQYYLPSSNVRGHILESSDVADRSIQVMQTKFMNEQGAVSLTGMRLYHFHT